MLPGETEAEMRRQIVELGIRSDSLQNRLRILENYSANIMSTISGKPTESFVSTVVSEGDTLVEASEAEREFVRDYDHSGRFNL